jgi:alkylation response protein AidB-like acyl-CoA dehydrogenase
MHFELSEEQLMIRQAARDFAQTELKPGVIERDEHQKFPAEQIKKLGELGFLGMMVSPQYGGSGMDALSYVLVMEELSKIDASASVVVSVNNSLVCYGLEKFGTEEQKQKYLAPLAKGEVIGAFCLSEPEAGSDATSQRTTAIDMGDHYLLNGTKNWITNGNSASTYIVIAQTDAAKKHHGINALIVEKGLPGFTIGPKENKMGIRGSDTHSLMFNDVKVPKENRIGDDGFGFKFAMTVLEGGRIGIAAQALGIAAGAQELAVEYAKQRNAFGKPIANLQAIQFKLADMATEIEAARLLCYRAAWLKDNHQPYGQAVRLKSGYGYNYRSGANSRRLWLCKGVSRGAPDARCQDHADIRRHFGNSENRHITRSAEIRNGFLFMFGSKSAVVSP